MSNEMIKYIALLTYCYTNDTSDRKQSFALQAQTEEDARKELKRLILARFSHFNSPTTVFLDIKVYQLESALGLDFQAIEAVTNSAIQEAKKRKEERKAHDLQDNR